MSCAEVWQLPAKSEPGGDTSVEFEPSASRPGDARERRAKARRPLTVERALRRRDSHFVMNHDSCRIDFEAVPGEHADAVRVVALRGSTAQPRSPLRAARRRARIHRGRYGLQPRQVGPDSTSSRTGPSGVMRMTLASALSCPAFTASHGSGGMGRSLSSTAVASTATSTSTSNLRMTACRITRLS